MTNPIQETILEPLGEGSYPRYHGLWHLKELNVVDSLATYKSAAWTKAHQEIKKNNQSRVRVALIDTSVDCKHPNLEGVINHELAIDLVSNAFGRFAQNTKLPKSDFDKFANEYREELEKEYKQLTSDLYSTKSDDTTLALGSEINDIEKILLLLGKMLDSLFGDQKKLAQPASLASFSSHGTSMAGIIAGTPNEVQLHVPNTLRDATPREDAKIMMPYAGINPFAEIVPISTSADPSAMQSLLALIYASVIGADLIVIAAHLAGPQKQEIDATSTDMLTKVQTSLKTEVSSDLYGDSDSPPGFQEDWELFDRFIKKVSVWRPIICAAGNSATDVLAYPASLARENDGILAIGARTSANRIASYSPGLDSNNKVTFFALSGDGERRDADLFRLDPYRTRAHQHENSGIFKEKDGKSAIELTAVEAILAPDVPGRFGQTGSIFLNAKSGKGSYFDPPSAYSTFSGTSAASAIAAGIISLKMATGDLGRPGKGYQGSVLRNALSNGQSDDPQAGLPQILY